MRRGLAGAIEVAGSNQWGTGNVSRGHRYHPSPVSDTQIVCFQEARYVSVRKFFVDWEDGSIPALHVQDGSLI